MELAGRYGGIPDKMYPPDIDVANLIIRTAYELVPYTKKIAGGDPESELIARIPAAVSKINMQGLTPEVATKLVITYNQKINQGI
jgi:hypothetical protein